MHISENKLDPILHLLILFEFILLQKYSKSIKGSQTDLNMTYQQRVKLSAGQLFIKCRKKCSLQCKKSRDCKKQWKCDWKNNANIMAF